MTANTEITLPIDESVEIVDKITSALSIPRTFLPEKDDISHALRELPRQLSRLSPNVRGPFIAKLAIATSVGLYDGALMYIWNAVITNLKSQVNIFGIEMIDQILSKKTNISEMTDFELIELSFKLNLINEQGLFALQQNRELRNSGLLAHPNDFELDSDEVINFISRCCKFGFVNGNQEYSGLAFKDTMYQIKTINISPTNLDVLADNLKNTFKLQQNFYIEIFYKIYISEKTDELVRSNILNVLHKVSDSFDDNIKTTLMDLHHNVVVEDAESVKAGLSRNFFQKIGIADLLSNFEKVAVFNKAIVALNTAHNGYNNFQNEVIFADNLHAISKQIYPAPDVVISDYVSTVFECYIGNRYGISTSSFDYYDEMISSLTPKGISKLFDILRNYRLASASQSQKEQLKELLGKFSNSSNLNLQQQNDLAMIRKRYINI